MHPPLTGLICEIKTLLILWKYQVILVIAYIFIIKVIMHCDIRLRVTVTCTFTIKHGTHVPVRVVTCSHLYDAYRL